FLLDVYPAYIITLPSLLAYSFLSFRTVCKEDPTQNLYRWAEYAQHYGVPTRFLDWTENPLVALYFACRYDKFDYRDESLGGKDAVVWMLYTRNYNKFVNGKTQGNQSMLQKSGLTISETIEKLIRGDKVIDYPILYKPYYLDVRMSAQSSYFMVWGNSQKPLDSFFTEENYLHSYKNEATKILSDNPNEIIFIFNIPVDRKQPILRELDTCGINERTLFPGLDGIGRYIEMKYKFDLEETKNML
ncbi:MAG: FRG domain-containing protein, partial [Clostridiales bacterium]|nr:FRG domain-containing protein [Clostridiales bacterium]